MDTISLNCAKCKQALKFPPARAGTKGKCTRCGTELTVPSVTAKPPAPAGMDDDDDGPMTYNLVEAVVEKKKAPDEKKDEKKKAVIEKRKKTLKDAGSWALARHGFVLMNVGAMIWLGIYALQMLVVLLGATQGMEYNTVRLHVLMADDPDNPAPPPAAGDMENLELCRFGVALVSGERWISLAMAVYILLAVVTLVQIACFMMGYFTCLSVPERFGARSQVKAMVVLAIINVCIIVVFRVLPLATGFSYTILPYLVPEIPTLTANMERMTPIHLTWTPLPFLGVLLTLIFICCQWAECTLGASFLRTVGMSIKDEPIKESGTSLIHMAMRAGFVFICYHIVSLNGASDVLINVLRLLYLLVVFSQFLFIYSYSRLLLTTHATLSKLLEGWVPSETQDEDEDDDEDEEDDDDKPKRKKSKRKRDEEDDDEEDDDDDDDDDDEDDRPRKRKNR